MAFSHTVGGTTFTQANFEGNAYSDESTGFPKAMEKMVEHVANAYRGTSTTSNAVGTGSKTWTVTNANSQIPAFAVGMPVRVSRTSAPTTTYMQGEITAFTASTGSTTVNVSSSLGSGTHTDWTITIGGHQTTASASPLAIADGGTGAGTAGAALAALGGATDGANSDITSLTGLTTPLTVAQGGSGAATHTANGVLLGAGTGAVTTAAPSTSGNVLTSNGTVWASAAAPGFANWAQSSGHLTPDNATYGIHLGVSTATAANLLADYEEGTFTPTLIAYSGTAPTSTYTGQTGRYTKIGRQITISAAVSTSSYTGGSSPTILLIGGLPFTLASSDTLGCGGFFCENVSFDAELGAGTMDVACTRNYSASQGVFLVLSQSGAGGNYVTWADWPSGSSASVNLEFTYQDVA